ncbi:MAG: hypothetical protein GKR89_19910 [Candidatus Latescibacteria bacterium]|nr:hypothetical protein [Candidatus Latescibacterota bacterium]
MNTAKKGRAWAWGLGAFYLAFAGSSLTFALYANTQRIDLVSTDYYQQATTYQAHLEKMQRSTALPADSSWSLSQSNGAWSLHFPVDQTASPSGTIHLYRPNDSRRDHHLTIALGPDGSQPLARNLQPGLWQVKVDWSRGETTYFSQLPLVVEP